MNRSIKYILYFTCGLLAIYGLIALPISNHLSGRYDLELNNKRSEAGLQIINEDWKLDSSRFEGYGDYSSSELEEIADWRLWLENEKIFCEYWSPNDKQGLGYFKLICYMKSFWLWKNRPLLEIDWYKKELENLQHAALAIGYDYSINESWAGLDTTVSQVKIDSIVDHAEQNGYVICGTALLELQGVNEFDTTHGKINILRAQRILNAWKKSKGTTHNKK